MKSLKTLIKLYSKQLEEKRRLIAHYEEQKEKLLYYSSEMTRQMEKERQVFADDPMMAAMTFHNYSRQIDSRQETIKRSLYDLDAMIEGILAEISETYGEVKKYEVMLRQQIVVESEQLKNHEGKALDEIAIKQFVQHMEES